MLCQRRVLSLIFVTLTYDDLPITISTMKRLKNSGSSTQVITNEDIIELTIQGRQTRDTVLQMGESIRDEIKDLRSRGKKIQIMADISGMSVKDSTSGSRQESRKLLASLAVDRAAIYGKGAWMGFIMYLIKVTGTAKNIRFFTSKRKAQHWLKTENQPGRKLRSQVGLVTGSILMLIGIFTLIGWQIDNDYLKSWIPTFRPMNPLSAVGLIIMGVGFICYWIKKLHWIRLTGAAGIGLGLAALSPLRIDAILFHDKVIAAGVHAQLADSAAICFIAMGVGALVAGRNWRVLWLIEYILIGVVGLLSVVNIFGQLYAHDWIYGIGSNFVMAYNLAIAFTVSITAFVFLIIYRRWKVSVVAEVSRVGWLIVIVLLLVQVATYGAWTQTINTNATTASANFRASANEIEGALTKRFSSYIDALYGFQGLFLASENVSKGEFGTYYRTTNTANNYPGLRALVFVSKVETKDLSAFIAQQRNDRSADLKGNPSFAVRSQSPASTHYISTYIAASDGVPGTDFASNSSRREAFVQAEALGKPLASGTIEFAATATKPAQAGFFITLPVAYQTNPNKVVGFVNAAFNYKDFFAEAFPTALTRKGLNIRITDILDGKVVYDVNKLQDAEFVIDKSIAVANRTWDIQVAAARNYGIAQNELPSAILFAGQAFSVLLIIIFWIQARGRRQALNLADDITKDLQAERNLAVTNNQKSTAILSSIGDGVFAIDTKGRITVLNHMAQVISGLSSEEAIGRPYDEVLKFEFEKDGKVNDSFIKKALKGHLASMTKQTVMVRSDGKRIPVADSAAPIRDAQNEIIGAIVVFRDASKEYELDKAKTEFVSLASHQLRTPLSAINWYGEMLLDGDAGKLTKNQHEYIKEIFEGSQRMSELVNSLLDVSRLEVGRLANQPAPTDMVEVINSLEKELKVSIENKKLEFHKDLHHTASIIADPKQLRMIAQNLMSNAVKYTTEKGAVNIILRHATVDDMKKAGVDSNAPHWFFSVQDNGYGIPKDQQPKIFGKLFRADNVRKLDVEGTGLGLYIVKEVVEKMDGRVWFESTESVGTTFYVVAPVEPKHKKQ
jgi:PAS domain S-box-containing protein